MVDDRWTVVVLCHAALGILLAASLSVTSRSAPHFPLTHHTRHAGQDIVDTGQTYTSLFKWTTNGDMPPLLIIV